ncbi:CpaF family protein [Dongshaea marina]|uniref:CpaF family protein n=1 Tax=Dongshaea marina TaxID=2047966 RepID=UPI000D3E5B08|nr:CpaF family protein [Dongshaea marina]
MNLLQEYFLKVRAGIFAAIEADMISRLTPQELREQISTAIDVIISREQLPVSFSEKELFVQDMVDELVGLGPMQSLMDDPQVSDIMINGPNQIYYEKFGKLEESELKFIDEIQLQTIAKRIASSVGRRIDESSPLCDARLHDGSRVNMVLPPLALDGTSISIRKFSDKSISLNDLVDFGAMTSEMAKLLMVATYCRLNIIISGGTGSGKTTLLNALSEYISDDERIITIEDAAELRLSKKHTLRLETRKDNIEGTGAIDQNKLLINALRMRPDRIVIGECRGAEALEMLQAMNTGHDGSMTTLHANTPRDAISRIENMVMMANASLPLKAIKQNISSAVDIIVQVKRLNDGSRRVTSISEVVGLEGDVIVMEEYYSLDQTMDLSGRDLNEIYIKSPVHNRSAVKKKADFFGLNIEL